MSKEQLGIVCDVKERRPACVLLQAGYGCQDGRRLVSSLFDASTWVLTPNDDLHMVYGTLEQWQDFAKECNKRFESKLGAK